MGNSLRCCLACVLPCGSLDVVRVVHLNGQVDEHSRPVLAGKILAANPNHAISKPCYQGGGVRRTLIVSPESELKRGRIYFLIQATAVPKSERRKTKKEKRNRRATRAIATPTDVSATDQSLVVVGGEGSLAEILPEKRPSHRRRRSGRVGV